MSLRARLTIGLVALAAVGLTVAGFATFTALRDFLVDRVDEQLADAFRRPLPRLDSIRNERGPALPGGGYREIRDAEGTVIWSDDSFLLDNDAPELPDDLPLGPFTFDPGGGQPQYRVAAQTRGDGNQLVIALPLDEVRRTLGRLVFIEIVVALAVLGALGVLGAWFVKVGLRPLERMGDTAGAIAAGDLSQRVEPTSEKTEVGRLGLSLNSMLTQIERAFAEREASEAKLRRFVADASHELRTPLTSIRGYSELFRRGASDNPEDLAKAMRRIEEEAQRMGVLVDDLLLLARLDQGRPVDREPVDLTRLATDAVDDAKAAYPDRVIEFTGNGPATVLGDEVRLRQVLANLMSNALTHTPEDAAVRVSIERDNGEAIVTIADEGPGMSAADAGHAFERFWRADESRTRTSGGAGLGLSIVQAITTAHGGRTELETTPGAGATFRVHLPITTP